MTYAQIVGKALISQQFCWALRCIDQLPYRIEPAIDFTSTRIRLETRIGVHLCLLCEKCALNLSGSRNYSANGLTLIESRPPLPLWARKSKVAAWLS